MAAWTPLLTLARRLVQWWSLAAEGDLAPDDGWDEFFDDWVALRPREQDSSKATGAPSP